jgi:hypothetical protein
MVTSQDIAVKTFIIDTKKSSIKSGEFLIVK